MNQSFRGQWLWLFVLVWGASSLLGAEINKQEQFVFVMIEYTGGSFLEERGALKEMHAHGKKHIPYFLAWLNKEKIVAARETPEVLKFSDKRIFDYPLLYITGHTDFTLDETEKANLKAHLERGGFLYIEDCGGTREELPVWGYFSKRIKLIVKELFPAGEWKVLPNDHDIYRFPFAFTEGLPNVVGENNDSKRYEGKKRKGQGGEGFYYKNRMISFFSDADNCCGWIWNGKHPDWGDIPFKVGANVVTYALTH
jgi:hypothetical protein